MKKKNVGKCHLCHYLRPLKLSHIIPKLLGKSIREVNTDKGNNNPRIYTLLADGYIHEYKQDTTKEYMLCADCEQNFSVFETYYSKSFSWLEYDINLYKFILSIFWRQITWFISFSKDPDNEWIYKEKFKNREEIRCFLDRGVPLKKEPLIYMFEISDGYGYAFDVHAISYASRLVERVSVFIRYYDGYQHDLLIAHRISDVEIHLFITKPLKADFSIANIYEYKGVEFYAIVSGNIVFLVQNDGMYIPGCDTSSIVYCGNGNLKKNIIPQAVNMVLNDYGRRVNYEAENRKQEDVETQIAFFDGCLESIMPSKNGDFIVVPLSCDITEPNSFSEWTPKPE